MPKLIDKKNFLKNTQIYECFVNYNHILVVESCLFAIEKLISKECVYSQAISGGKVVRSISKVFHTIKRCEMTVQQYEQYLENHSQQRNIKAIICVECGDEIIYCKGEHNVSYFKHIPTHDGHSYCSLYHEGKESNSYKSCFIKQLFQNKDISLNFEIRYFNNSWISLLTIPPLKKDDINIYEQNKASIFVEAKKKRQECLPIDGNHFAPGETKLIGLSGFPGFATISISGSNTSTDKSYKFECFHPDNQIYSNLILQEYEYGNAVNIDLNSIKMFICKRVTGSIYIGRHYLIFNRSENFNISDGEITTRKIIFKQELKVDYQTYYVFDIIFHKITNKTKEFCASRNCDLLEKNDAVVLWPPLNSVGNYKYYKKDAKKMFVAFEDDSRTLDFCCYSTDKLWFKIKNNYFDSFYVTQQTKEPPQKLPSIIADNKSGYIIDNKENKYLFENGVLIRKADKNNIILKSGQTIIAILDRLNRTIYSKQETNELLSTYGKFLHVIRYSRPYSTFSKNEYDYLRDKYNENQIVIEYLEMCLRQKKIKKLVKQLLLEEEL